MSTRSAGCPWPTETIGWTVGALASAAIITSRDAVDAILHDAASYPTRPGPPILGHARPSAADDDHSEFRARLEPALAHQQVLALGRPMVALLDELIEPLTTLDEIDFGAQFSRPFAAHVLLMTVIGVPTPDFESEFIDRGQAASHLTDNAVSGDGDALAGVRALLERALKYRNYTPPPGPRLPDGGAEPGPPLVPGLIHTLISGDGSVTALAPDRAIALCAELVDGGTPVLAATLDTVFGYLASHPAERARVTAHPARLRVAVEELLRCASPVHFVERVSAGPACVQGQIVRAGQPVVAVLGTANADEALVAEARQVQLDRSVNPHLAFGVGIHRCLGGHLTRLALRVALREWHARIPGYRPAPGWTPRPDDIAASTAGLRLVLGSSG